MEHHRLSISLSTLEMCWVKLNYAEVDIVTHSIDTGRMLRMGTSHNREFDLRSEIFEQLYRWEHPALLPEGTWVEIHASRQMVKDDVPIVESGQTLLEVGINEADTVALVTLIETYQQGSRFMESLIRTKVYMQATRAYHDIPLGKLYRMSGVEHFDYFMIELADKMQLLDRPAYHIQGAVEDEAHANSTETLYGWNGQWKPLQLKPTKLRIQEQYPENNGDTLSYDHLSEFWVIAVIVRATVAVSDALDAYYSGFVYIVDEDVA